MKTFSFIGSLALFTILMPAAAIHAAVPANDTFEKAAVLTGRLITLNNQNGASATANALDPFVGAPTAAKPVKSIWYRLDAQVSTDYARLTITDNTTTGIRAGVFRLGDPDGGAGSLIPEAQMTITGGMDVDSLTFSLTRGARYYIVIDSPGSLNLHLKIPGPQNDFFEDAQVLTGNEGTVTSTNLDATDEGDTPPVPSPLRRGVWFKWTPTTSVPVIVDTRFSELVGGHVHDTFLCIYTGTALNNLVLLDNNDDASGAAFELNSQISFTTVAGTTYYIWAGTFSTNRDGPITLSYFPATSPGVFVLDAPVAAGENQGKVTVPIRRLRAGAAANVTLFTTNGSATAGIDYSSYNVVQTFGAGVFYTSSAAITLLPDNAVEGNETFSVTLSAPTSGAVLGIPSTAVITIRDAQTVSGPRFGVAYIKVNEKDGLTTIPLQRSAGIDSAMEVSFSYNSNGETAREGVDYILPEKIIFEPGQSFCTTSLLIKNNGAYTGTRSFILVVSSPGFNNDYLGVVIEDDDLVVPVAGRVSAILDSGGIAGGVDITVNANGTVTGKVTMARGVFPVIGKLDATGRLTVRLGPATGPLRTLQLQLINGPARTYQITLNDGELGSVSETQVVATQFTASSPTPRAGKYTCFDIGGGSAPIFSAGLCTVSPLGSATYSGKLFDGTPFLASGSVGSTGAISVACSLFAGKGRLTLNLLLPSTIDTRVVGTLTLLRPGRANQTVELPPIDAITALEAARYVPPPPGQRILSVWGGGTGNAELTAGGFPAMVTKPFTVTPANKLLVTTLLPEKLTLTLFPATGLYTGTLIPTGATTPKAIYGYLIQSGGTSEGKGFFLSGIIPGVVRLRGP